MGKARVVAPKALMILVGKNIRELRQTRGLSQTALADMVGMHTTYICSVELGRTNLTLSTIARIAQALGVEPFRLLVPVIDIR